MRAHALPLKQFQIFGIKPMTTMQQTIGRLEKMYNELRNLQKAAKRGGATQKAKEKAFNISHAFEDAIMS